MNSPSWSSLSKGRMERVTVHPILSISADPLIGAALPALNSQPVPTDLRRLLVRCPEREPRLSESQQGLRPSVPLRAQVPRPRRRPQVGALAYRRAHG